ncbi:hypothetical protein [Escherichia coli]|uniref:hypothetical protein n=1 Tax=Escherichia coli TaxID=562 RepID=UPI0010544EB2|nr:hypothetical protein [Escherichia coli]VEW02182.1 conserved hypothetical protein [Escherichia coli]VEW04066.1 conserved hypothetical protein [Escherichia coli]
MKELKQLRKAGLHVVVHAPLFRSGYFVFAYNWEQWETLHRVFGLNIPEVDSAQGLAYDFIQGTKRIFAIGVFRGGLETLVHECAHTTFAFCYYANINVKRELANETFCYLLDWLFGEGIKGNRAAFRLGLEEEPVHRPDFDMFNPTSNEE